MERKEFAGLLKDLMPRIHDYAVLETHPLAALVQPILGFQGSRGEYLQWLVFDAIEHLQPRGIKSSLNAVEWRPYLILHKRYVRGISLQELSAELCLSDRQLRRDHNRALQALAGRLWDRAFRPQTAGPIEEGETAAEGSAKQDRIFEIHQELLDLSDLLHGVANVLSRRLSEEEVELELDLLEGSPHALGDRIILRQILLSLFNYSLHLLSGKTIGVSLSAEREISFRFQVDGNWSFWRAEEHEDLFESVSYWSLRLHASIREEYPPEGQEGEALLQIRLPGEDQATVMVVDDQQPALRMYQRYLSRTGLKVMGVTDPNQVMILARQIQPVLITLDIMMPMIDGWELLQALQMDAATRHIPVIICSAWEEPELAKSLGAAGFLKKPITQKDLLGVLEQLNLIA